MKNVKLILASFCLVLVGCSDDDDPASSTYSENASGLFDGTGTQEECEAAYTALLLWLQWLKMEYVLIIWIIGTCYNRIMWRYNRNLHIKWNI